MEGNVENEQKTEIALTGLTLFKKNMPTKYT